MKAVAKSAAGFDTCDRKRGRTIAGVSDQTTIYVRLWTIGDLSLNLNLNLYHLNC